MGMSTHVAGFVPPDETFQKMLAIWNACAVAGVQAPTAVLEFFDYAKPDPEGVEVDQPSLERNHAVREWKNEYGQGFEVVLDNVPAHVRVIRFWNSW